MKDYFCKILPRQ